MIFKYSILLAALTLSTITHADFLRLEALDRPALTENQYLHHNGLVQLGNSHAAFSIMRSGELRSKPLLRLLDGETSAVSPMLTFDSRTSLYTVRPLAGQATQWLIDIEGQLFVVDTNSATSTMIYDFGMEWIGGSPGDLYTNIEKGFLVNGLYFITLRNPPEAGQSHLWMLNPKSLTITPVNGALMSNFKVHSVQDDPSRSDRSVLLYGASLQGEEESEPRLLQFNPSYSTMDAVGHINVVSNFEIGANRFDFVRTTKGLFFCGSPNLSQSPPRLMRISNSLTIDIIDQQNYCADVSAYQDQLVYFNGDNTQAADLIMSNGLVGDHRVIFPSLQMALHWPYTSKRNCVSDKTLYINDSLGSGKTWVVDKQGEVSMLFEQDRGEMVKCIGDQLLIVDYNEDERPSSAFLYYTQQKKLQEIRPLSPFQIDSLILIGDHFYTNSQFEIGKLRYQKVSFLPSIFEILIE